MRQWRVLAVFALACALIGCGSYELRGRGITGEASYIMVVDADDPALDGGSGVQGAVVTLSTDPERLNRKVVGSAVSGPDGWFQTPFDELGGGFLQYDAGVRVTRSGYQSAEHFFRLPGSSKRLLVVLAPGRDLPGTQQEDPYETYQRYRRD